MRENRVDTGEFRWVSVVLLLASGTLELVMQAIRVGSDFLLHGENSAFFMLLF